MFTSGRARVTLLRTDIVGSTRRAAEVGDAQWSRLLGRHRQLVARHRSELGGIDLGSAGDGFLMAFQRPLSAVAAAAGIRSDASRLGLSVRCGIHTGDCQQEGDQFVGMALHIASRAEGVAKPGQIVVTSDALEALAETGLTFSDLGSRELKGVPGSWQIFGIDRIPLDIFAYARRLERRTRERRRNIRVGRRAMASLAIVAVALVYVQQREWGSPRLTLATLGSATGMVASASREGARITLDLRNPNANQTTRIGSYGHLGSVSWSPDGCRLSFVAGPDPSRSHIHMTDLVGHLARVTTSPGDYRIIEWSSDAERLLISRGGLDDQLFLLNVREGTTRPATLTEFQRFVEQPVMLGTPDC